MFDAQILMTDGTNNAVYSPWFPRSAENAKFTVEVIGINATKLVVAMYTKNNEDTDDGGPITGATVDISSATTGTITVSAGANGMQELVRFKFTVEPNTSGKWVMFRVLPTVWYDTTKTT